jgi:hypothetical protein
MRFAFPIATAAVVGILMVATIRDPGPHHHPGVVGPGDLPADVVSLESPLTLWGGPATLTPLDPPVNGLLSAPQLLDLLRQRHAYLPAPAQPLRLVLVRFASSAVTPRPAWLVIDQHVMTVPSGPPDSRPPPQDSDVIDVIDAISGTGLITLSGPAALLPPPLAAG